jgi:hypothetical protein
MIELKTLAIQAVPHAAVALQGERKGESSRDVLRPRVQGEPQAE